MVELKSLVAVYVQVTLGSSIIWRSGRGERDATLVDSAEVLSVAKVGLDSLVAVHAEDA